MKSKTIKAYEKMFNFISNEIGNQEIMLICDFEIAQIIAFKNIFDKSTVRGCYFHFTQIIWRWIQQLGLVIEYKNFVIFKEFIRKLISLCFLPSDYIIPAFILIKERYSTTSSSYYKIIDKFERNYIYSDNTLTGTHTFWNCYERIKNNMPLTTNALEGYHRFINNSFKTAHPNLAIFLDFLIKEELRISIKITEVMKGKSFGRKLKEYKNIQNIITNINYYTLEEILEAICYNIKIKLY